MINVPVQFQPIINTIYPPNNEIEFERWFFKNYTGDETGREYLPIFWTGFYVNNAYGNDVNAIYELQLYLQSKLDKKKKYFTIVQYDDAILNDVSELDLYQFNMSKSYDYPIPLLGQPHPYKYSGEKKYLANFVGSLTHPIREHAKSLIGNEDYYISFDRHEPYEYCKIISESVYTLCYRGYGLNSFRIAEAIQYNSIPVYISDEFINPYNIDFNEYGLTVKDNEVKYLEEMLLMTLAIRPCNETIKNLYTYEGCRNKILEHLLTL